MRKLLRRVSHEKEADSDRDQLTKQWAVAVLKGKESLVLIKGVLEFSYLENTGAAFGSFRGLQIPLILVTLVIIVFVVYKLVTLPDNKRFYPIRICGVFLISGAVGNLIDRVMNRYVVDFIYFVPIDFPKFNVADCYVTVTVFVLIFLFLFLRGNWVHGFEKRPKKG